MKCSNRFYKVCSTEVTKNHAPLILEASDYWRAKVQFNPEIWTSVARFLWLHSSPLFWILLGLAKYDKEFLEIKRFSFVDSTGIYIKFTDKPSLTDTRLIWTPHNNGQFALSLGKESPYICSKFNPLNTDIFSAPLSVCINVVWP